MAVLANRANAQLTFKIPADPPVIGEYGNLESVIEDYVVMALLQSDSQRNGRREVLDGVAHEKIAVKGNCKTPSTLDPRIEPGTRCEAILNGKTYNFILDLTLGNPVWPNESNVIGQPISGTLTRTVIKSGA